MTLGLGRERRSSVIPTTTTGCEPTAARRGDRGRPGGGRHADRRRRDRRDDVVDVGRPGGRCADVAERERLWLHVDAAYAGAVAIIAGAAGAVRGWERADSIVINPHKWLFTPLDASLLLTPRMEALRDAFSLVPEYLRTLDRDGAGARLQRVHAAARAAVPGAEAVDPAPLVRSRGPAPADPAPHRARAGIRGLGRRRARLGAPRPGAVLDGLLPLPAGRARRRRRGTSTT